jgi:hypothetical protein
MASRGMCFDGWQGASSAQAWKAVVEGVSGDAALSCSKDANRSALGTVVIRKHRKAGGSDFVCAPW